MPDYEYGWVRDKRAAQTHRGVKIYKETEFLLNLHELKSGAHVERPPIKNQECFVFGDSAKYDSIPDIKEAIDRLHGTLLYDDEKEFAAIMNQRKDDTDNITEN